ncbi:hypothetical protein NE619_13725 [Anaerovorax odorimutans]|uniref:Uncharacterized protein n=1 Tax=Anaerovorax odorimutans TaxID=109327 RepID=A0ABT1RRG3_9FIRM|nr:hypothetical protein [Anaerovorax odorimutans]MCQ4637789.1 hypothetical protein [Anaerovorax odorimutans]
MVRIRYRLFEDMDWLRTTTTKEFEREIGSFWGFFELKINNKRIGIYHDNEIEEWEMGREIINMWFITLMDAIKALRCSNIVTMHIIDGIGFLEFRREGESLRIKYGASEEMRETGSAVRQWEVKAEAEDILFDNEYIGLAELEEEVRKKCGMFIEEVRSLNEELVYSSCVQGLIDKLETL